MLLPLLRRHGRNAAALSLLALSLSSMAGDLLGLTALKGLGALSTAAPLPKVFSDVRGLEPFASEFAFEIERPGQPVQIVSITPELYGRLAGPYNRRNVYGAALSYAPRLPEPLWRQVFGHALCPGGPLRLELGLEDDPAAEIRVILRTRTRGRNDTWRLEAPCSR